MKTRRSRLPLLESQQGGAGSRALVTKAKHLVSTSDSMVAAIPHQLTKKGWEFEMANLASILKLEKRPINTYCNTYIKKCRIHPVQITMAMLQWSLAMLLSEAGLYHGLELHAITPPVVFPI